MFCDAADFPDEKVVLLSQIAQTRKCFCSFSVPPFTHFPVDALESAPRVVKNTDGADVVLFELLLVALLLGSRAIITCWEVAIEASLAL